MGLACVAGVVTLIPLLGVSTLETPVQVRLVQPGVVIGMTMTIMTGVAIGLACFLTPIPWGMVAYGRYMSVQKKEFSNELVAKAEDLNHDGVYRRTCPEYVGEGRDVSVVVSLDNNGVRSFMAPARCRPRICPSTCACSACWATFPLCYTRSRKPYWWWPVEPV